MKYMINEKHLKIFFSKDGARVTSKYLVTQASVQMSPPRGQAS